MPIWLRKFTIKEINDFNEKNKNEEDSDDKKTLIDTSGKINSPDFLQGKSSYK